ncbi:protein delta homolog 1 [Aplochiton taeniatus]
MMCISAFRFFLVVTAAGACKGLECSAGCNLENGFCEKPGECRCRAGWQGPSCDQCIPFPGCLHGTCEKAWQCVCQDGWLGSQCDQDNNLCSAKPCSGTSTCIETEEGGYLCVCPHGYTGENCNFIKGPCLTDGSPCQNGGVCTDHNSSAAYSSCVCSPGFTGDFCENRVSSCGSNPCLNGGNCTNLGPTFTCTCRPGFLGLTCNDTATLSLCASRPCANGGTCVDRPDGTFRCVCSKGFAGPTCSQQHRLKPRPKVGRVPAQRALSPPPQHYSLPAHAFHKLLSPPDRDLLKITLKETIHSDGGSVSQGQLLCFGMLALLTCLVILGTTGIVFFGRCEAWLANAKYSQLVRQQREHLLRGAAGSGHDEPEHSVNIILPEKIRFTSSGRHYTSI